MIGKQYGPYTIVAETGKSSGGHGLIYLVECRCGARREANTTWLGSALGSSHCRKCLPSRASNFAGRTFGRLRVVERDGYIDAYVAWKCECECGKIVRLRANCFTRKNPQRSCGCLLPDMQEAKKRESASQKAKREEERRAWLSAHPGYKVVNTANPLDPDISVLPISKQAKWQKQRHREGRCITCGKQALINKKGMILNQCLDHYVGTGKAL